MTAVSFFVQVSDNLSYLYYMSIAPEIYLLHLVNYRMSCSGSRSQWAKRWSDMRFLTTTPSRIKQPVITDVALMFCEN